MPGQSAPLNPSWTARLSTPGSPVCSAEWLALRERADDAARSTALVASLRRHLPRAPLLVHDLGCGTGSQGRWLAPRLPQQQHWVLHDRDPELLAVAVASMPAGVTVEAREGDVADLDPRWGRALVTASALLDMLTPAAVERIAATGCPTLLTLSVTGRVAFTPSEPLDAAVASAFNAHQRRAGMLGPDAVAVAAAAFRRRGAAVVTASSPWRLGSAEADLVEEWLRGWLAAAVEHDPGLRDSAPAYLARRLAALTRGELRVVVGHTDLLALPGGGS